MSKRVNLTLSDDFIVWIEAEAQKAGIPVATFAMVLLNEARRNREMQSMSDGLFLFLKSMTDDERKVLFSGIENWNDTSSVGVLSDKLKKVFQKE